MSRYGGVYAARRFELCDLEPDRLRLWLRLRSAGLLAFWDRCLELLRDLPSLTVPREFEDRFALTG